MAGHQMKEVKFYRTELSIGSCEEEVWFGGLQLDFGFKTTWSYEISFAIHPIMGSLPSREAIPNSNDGASFWEEDAGGAWGHGHSAKP